ncbi:RNA-directed DNA polymerase, eukaryota [Tanacetum coccineum]
MNLSGSTKLGKDKEGKKTTEAESEVQSPPGFTLGWLRKMLCVTILEVMDEVIKMNFLSLNIQGLGHKAKKGWIQELNNKYRINFVAIQETKMKRIDLFSIKVLWGNLSFDYAFSPSVGSSGDFNEVHSEQERYGTTFNHQGAYAFNNFINMAGLVDLPLEGPILLRELNVDYGPTLFRIFHSWFNKAGFDKLKKFQALKSSIKQWSYEDKQHSNATKLATQYRLSDLDKIIDQGRGNVDLVNERYKLSKELQDLNSSSSLDIAQKAKIRWSIKGDETSKYFHGIINKKRSQLAIRGVLAQGKWIDDPSNVKHEFFSHFSSWFSAPSSHIIILDHQFPVRLSMDQNDDLERTITYEEIKRAVWDCGINKSPGPDGFTFEFFRRYWNVIDIDVVEAVLQFFSLSKFPRGCNPSFITLISKMQDAKVVKDFCPISLIGSMHKIISKILANRLSMVISDLVSDVQSAFVSNRQILDGPFILNELISWCKHNKIKAMIFRVDFEKAFDLVSWDYLDDVLNKFGFGVKWRGWIQGCLNSAMGSILVNGSPTSEFKFFKGLKQGDPLSHFLFIMIMESLHLSFKNVLDASIFKGIDVNESLTLSHLFYTDDAVFVGK